MSQSSQDIAEFHRQLTVMADLLTGVLPHNRLAMVHCLHELVSQGLIGEYVPTLTTNRTATGARITNDVGTRSDIASGLKKDEKRGIV